MPQLGEISFGAELGKGGTGGASTGAAAGTVFLPNSAGTQVPALASFTQFANDTAGSESTRYVLQGLTAGLTTTFIDIRGDGTTLPQGAALAPALKFAGLNNRSGIYVDPADQSIHLGFDNGAGASNDWTFNNGGLVFQPGGGSIALGASGAGVVRDFNAFGVQVCGGALDGSTLKDTIIGQAAVEVPIGATKGFCDMPKMSPGVGPTVKPTGVPDTNGVLHTAPEIWDDSNKRKHVWSNAGAAWYSSPVYVIL